MRRVLFLAITLILILVVNLAAKVGGGDVTMKNSFGNTVFSHDIHTQKKLSCQSCHPEPYLTAEKHQTITMKQMEQGQSCGLCHDGKQAFTVKGSCNVCHKR